MFLSWLSLLSSACRPPSVNPAATAASTCVQQQAQRCGLMACDAAGSHDLACGACRAPRAAVAASEPASPAEQDTLTRPMQKCRHVGTAAFGSGQDALQSGQHLGTKASRPGFQAAAQARAGPTSRSGTSQAGSGLDVPARREQQAGRSGSPGASGSGPTMPAQSKQASGRNLHSSGSKASAPAPGIRGTATNDDCIDLSKLMMPAFRAPQTLASDLATNDVVIDLT